MFFYVFIKNLNSVFNDEFKLSPAASCAFEENFTALSRIGVNGLLCAAVSATRPFSSGSYLFQKATPPNDAPAIATLSS